MQEASPHSDTELFLPLAFFTELVNILQLPDTSHYKPPFPFPPFPSPLCSLRPHKPLMPFRQLARPNISQHAQVNRSSWLSVEDVLGDPC
jgi:hypothetical protein